MIYIVLNLVPIALASALALLFGWAYRTVFFAGQAIGLPAVIGAAAAIFWLNAILAGALILAPAKGGPWKMALGSAFVIWIGFVLPALAATGALHGFDIERILADAAYWLVAMLAGAATMQAIGLQAPPDD